MNILPKSLASGITSIRSTHGMEEVTAGMVLNKGIKLCGQRAFPFLWLRLGVWHSADIKIPLQNVRMLELRACGRERWAPRRYPAAQAPKPVSAAHAREK